VKYRFTGGNGENGESDQPLLPPLPSVEYLLRVFCGPLFKILQEETEATEEKLILGPLRFLL
jgi:hypothetical protein